MTGEEAPDRTLDFTDGFARVELNHKYGYLTRNGAKLTGIKYYRADPFSWGFGLVQVENLYNVVDTNGAELFEYSTYEQITTAMKLYRDRKRYFLRSIPGYRYHKF